MRKGRAPQQYFLKDKKIVVYKKLTMKDKQGFQTTGYMPIHPTANVWGYFKELSATLIYASNTTTAKEESQIAINYTEALKRQYPQDYYVLFDNVLYQVTRVDNYEGYKTDLVLYVKSTNTNTATMTTFDYDPTKL